jgi:hypothetical protein
MSRFPAAGHLISWPGLCPRNDESAGKRRSTRLRKGAPWLKTTLVQCAWAATHKKRRYLQAHFQRLRHRRGPKKAICAVAASILTAAYHMLRDGTFYQDLGVYTSIAPQPRPKPVALSARSPISASPAHSRLSHSSRFLFSRQRHAPACRRRRALDLRFDRPTEPRQSRSDLLPNARLRELDRMPVITPVWARTVAVRLLELPVLQCDRAVP